MTVALSLPSPGLQAGSVQGTKVVFSKGLEPELARALAARLGVKTVRFVNEPLFSKLVAKGPKPWDFAIAAITITPTRAARTSRFTAPYLTADQGVLVRKGLEPGADHDRRAREAPALQRASDDGRAVHRLARSGRRRSRSS